MSEMSLMIITEKARCALKTAYEALTVHNIELCIEKKNELSGLCHADYTYIAVIRSITSGEFPSPRMIILSSILEVAVSTLEKVRSVEVENKK